MNLHGHSFEDLLEISASVEDPEEIRALIESLDRLEKNLRYMRKRLAGKLAKTERRMDEERDRERQRRKASFKVLKTEKQEKNPPKG